MSSEVPKSLRREVDYIGPFSYHVVVVDGWSVPFLEATPMSGGRVHLSLDQRFGIDLDLKEAETIVPFLANAIAIALGYPSHPDRRTERRPAVEPLVTPRRLQGVVWVEGAAERGDQPDD